MDVEGDPRDQTLALERFVELGGGTDPDKRQSGFGRQRLHQRQLALGEMPRLSNGGDNDADHAVWSNHRHERAARDSRDLPQPAIDEWGRLDVEDGEGGSVPRRGADARRLAGEIDHLVEQRLDVGSPLARRHDPGASAALFDGSETDEIELEQLCELVQRELRHGAFVSSPGQCAREAPTRFELPARAGRLGARAGVRSGAEQSSLASVRHQDDDRNCGDQDRRQRGPDAAGERLAGDEHRHAEDGESDADAREEQRDRGSRRSGAGEHEPDHEVQRRQHEQRDCVQKDRLGLYIHWLCR